MKAAVVFTLVLAASLIPAASVLAQAAGGGAAADRYRGTSRYGVPATPVQPAQPTTQLPQAQPMPEGVYQFRNLVTNTAFYFHADTNQSFLWIKVSSTTASNTVNKKVTKLPSTVWVKPHVIGTENPSPAPAADAAPAATTDAAAAAEQRAAFERRYGNKQGQPPK